LKRLTIGLATTLAMLIAAGSAFAASDIYSGGYSFHGTPGSKSRPAALSFTQHFAVKTSTPGSLTGIITEVKTEISGVKVTASGFSKCTSAEINKRTNAKFDGICSKKALVAQGTVKAQVGTAIDWTPTGQTCNPFLDVWNAGPHTLSLFFRAPRPRCLNGNMVTGVTPAFTATYKQVGDNLLVDIPVPRDVTNPGFTATSVPPFFMALTSEYLTWRSTTNSKGVHDITSTGCKGQRHFSYTFTAHDPGGRNETKTIRGEARCG
jgi:hypothetical protein